MTLRKLAAMGFCLLALGTAGVAAADDFGSGNCCPKNDSDDCCIPECMGGWSIYGDLLYWNIRKCSLDYAWREEFTDGSNDIPNEIGIGPAKAVEPDYDLGFRVGASKTCDCMTFGIRYTYYDNKETATMSDSGLNYQAARVLPGTRNDSYTGDGSTSYVESNFDFARSVYDVELNVIDIEVAKAFDMDCGVCVSFFGGFRAAFLDQELSTEYGNLASITTDQTYVHEVVNFDAYGIYLGGEGTWSVCNGFGLFGRFGIATLVADFERSFLQKNINSSVDFAVAQVEDSMWCHINELEFVVAVEYEGCECMCIDWSIRFGYELHTWFNLADFLNFCGTNSGIEGHPARQKDSIGFDGIFVRLGARF